MSPTSGDCAGGIRGRAGLRVLLAALSIFVPPPAIIFRSKTGLRSLGVASVSVKGSVCLFVLSDANRLQRFSYTARRDAKVRQVQDEGEKRGFCWWWFFFLLRFCNTPLLY